MLNRFLALITRINADPARVRLIFLTVLLILVLLAMTMPATHMLACEGVGTACPTP
jgi:hypothetical protein